MIITDLLASMHDRFARAGLENPALDAELIAGFVLGESRGGVQRLAVLGHELTPDEVQRIEHLASDRESRVPLQHLTGRAAFRGIELEVGPGVFIPRPETELVTQLAIDELHADASPEPIVIDLCTGSGTIALAIVNEVDRARVTAIELDDHALAWARRNVQRLGDDRVTLLHGDAGEVPPEIEPMAGTVSVVVTNPPYVPTGAIPIDPEVRDHDPERALYSGEDGLDLIRRIAANYRRVLRPGGLIVIEHAEMQGESIRNLLLQHGWSAPATHRDLTLRDRVTTARA